jgi:hypothetical protein
MYKVRQRETNSCSIAISQSFLCDSDDETLKGGNEEDEGPEENPNIVPDSMQEDADDKDVYAGRGKRGKGAAKKLARRPNNVRATKAMKEVEREYANEQKQAKKKPEPQRAVKVKSKAAAATSESDCEPAESVSRKRTRNDLKETLVVPDSEEENDIPEVGSTVAKTVEGTSSRPIRKAKSAASRKSSVISDSGIDEESETDPYKFDVSVSKYFERGLPNRLTLYCRMLKLVKRRKPAKSRRKRRQQVKRVENR